MLLTQWNSQMQMEIINGNPPICAISRANTQWNTNQSIWIFLRLVRQVLSLKCCLILFVSCVLFIFITRLLLLFLCCHICKNKQGNNLESNALMTIVGERTLEGVIFTSVRIPFLFILLLLFCTYTLLSPSLPFVPFHPSRPPFRFPPYIICSTPINVLSIHRI